MLGGGSLLILPINNIRSSLIMQLYYYSLSSTFFPTNTFSKLYICIQKCVAQNTPTLYVMLLN